jgi:DNA-binding phage protein
MTSSTAAPPRTAITPEQAAANLAAHRAGRKSVPTAAPASPAHGTHARRSRSAKSDRWATYNQFVDSTLRDIGEAESKVWLILFRDVRNGLARTGMSDIARRAGLSRRGVVKAIAGLKRRRLVEVITRGSVNGSPNSYRVHAVAPREP